MWKPPALLGLGHSMGDHSGPPRRHSCSSSSHILLKAAIYDGHSTFVMVSGRRSCAASCCETLSPLGFVLPLRLAACATKAS